MAEKDVIYTQNRELSWLRFDERVLEEALEKDVPAFEKLKSSWTPSSNRRPPYTKKETEFIRM